MYNKPKWQKTFKDMMIYQKAGLKKIPIFMHVLTKEWDVGVTDELYADVESIKLMNVWEHSLVCSQYFTGTYFLVKLFLYMIPHGKMGIHPTYIKKIVNL